MSDRVECADCPVSLLCYAGRLGRTWNEALAPNPRRDPNDMLIDSFHAFVCPQCGMMTAYTAATGLELNVSFECCMRSREDIQDLFRTQSRFSGSTLNRAQKSKRAYYLNAETGVEYQVWFLMDDPGPGEHIVAMQCRECKREFEETVEGLARRVTVLCNYHIQTRLRVPKELQCEVVKLAESIGGEFIDVVEEVYVRNRDLNTGAPLDDLHEWDEDGEGCT
jgi:hypothetical protein